MITLRYGLIGAYKAGYEKHPQLVLQEMGYVVQVDELIEPLPSFLDIVDWKFTE